MNKNVLCESTTLLTLKYKKTTNTGYVQQEKQVCNFCKIL